MDNALFDWQAADREIISSLINTNRILWGELEAERARVRVLREQRNRRTESMSKILQDLEGKLYIAHEVEELTVDAAEELVSLFEEDLSQVKAFLERAAGTGDPAAPVDAPAQPDQPAQPVDQPAAPEAPVEQPAVPEAAPSDAPAAPDAPVDPSAQPAAPEAPAAPVDQPVDPSAPADPNAVPPLQ